MPQGAQTHRDVIARLRAALDSVVGPVIAPVRAAPYALLDFPNHSNVGDSAIYLGEAAWLHAQTGRRPAWVNDVSTPPDADRIPPDATILIHGGGNFGDIYPRHQALRERVLADYRGRPAILLPQSIHYGDPALADSAARALAGHGAATLLVRDRPSLDFARARFDCTVALCPDFAFGLGPLSRPAAPSRDVLLLLRTDTEAVGQRRAGAVPPDWPVEDWLDEPADTRVRAARASKQAILKSLDPRRMTPRARRVAYYQALADSRLARGVAQLSTARFVITDRLHGHILCTLLGIPHAYLDNAYGKIARFAAAFETTWDGVTPAASLTQAIGAAEDHLARAAHG